MENWKDIEGFNGDYLVSDQGRVKSNLSNRILKPSKDDNGYLRVGLRLNGKYKFRKVHRLVAYHFLENPNNYTWVKVKKNKDDCSVSNLEWRESPKDREMPKEKLIEYYNSLNRSEWRDDQNKLFKYIKTEDGSYLSDIYENLYNVWLGWLIKLTEDVDKATMILHDSYEAFTKSLLTGRYRIDRANVNHSIDIYIKRLVRNSCTNWNRKNKKSKQIVFVDEYW